METDDDHHPQSPDSLGVMLQCRIQQLCEYIKQSRTALHISIDTRFLAIFESARKPSEQLGAQRAPGSTGIRIENGLAGYIFLV